jgi:hypothetical protein
MSGKWSTANRSLSTRLLASQALKAATRPGRGERAQALVVIVLAFLALLAFVGLVTDVGSLYVTYTALKRAVDAGAVAAANNIKGTYGGYSNLKIKVTEAAREMLSLHRVTNVTTLQVFLCEDADHGLTLPAQFDTICPDPGEARRKLAWVYAEEASPVYFLSIFGVQSFTMKASAVGEAATLDLVLVFDTSESMGKDTPGYSANPNDFDPTACNANNTCEPLATAKNAANELVDKLYSGYDQVSVVTYDFDAETELGLTDNMTNVANSVVSMVTLHDDAPYDRLSRPLETWKNSAMKLSGRINPIYPEDRDGDGADADPTLSCTDANNDLLDDTNPTLPCDNDLLFDVYDWNLDGTRDILDHNYVIASGMQIPEDFSYSSTCTGCGLRVGTQILANNGRPNGVWVIVLLSDGVANMSDMALTGGPVPSQYTYGFCGSSTYRDNNFWAFNCIDWNISGYPYYGVPGRYCIDSDPDECPPPPYSTHTTTSKPYSVDDYARDMADAAALMFPTNPDEPIGQDIVIYVIGLGAASAGEDLLRYVANVGRDGDRENDPCDGVPAEQHCGNYYYSPNASYLGQIFEHIASQIFTKISH